MVPLTSLLIPIVVSAVLVFIVSSIIHMATPFHKNDFEKLPDEDGTMGALRPFKIPPGDYFFPRPASMAAMGTPEFKARQAAGPIAILTVRPPEAASSMTTNLVLWFVYSIAVSLIAGYVAWATLAPGAEYLKVFQVTGCVAFTGYALSLPQNSIWWGRNWAMTFRAMFDGLVYGLFTGGVFGWLWP